MKIQNYEITIKKIISLNNRFSKGDIVEVGESRGDHDNEIGIIAEVRDNRENKNLIEAGRGWYYLVEYDRASTEEREEDLSLIKKIEELIN